MTKAAIDLKGEMNMQNILHIHTVDVRKVLHALGAKRDEAPQFFLRSPVILDCKSLGGESASLDFEGLMVGVRALSFVPVGIRHLSPDAIQPATDQGWAILRDSTSKHQSRKRRKKGDENVATVDSDTPTSNATTNSTTTNNTATSKNENEGQSEAEFEIVHTPNRVMVLNRPIRSGQQVYSPEGDIVVLSQTGAGSEVLADGSVHVYGKISGRVLAGVNGDRSARIFCQGLEAELIAIAGNYQLLDEIDTPLKGEPAMIFLEGEKLMIEPMT